MENQGRVALVTGAARGQGRTIAIGLAESGCDIVAIDVAAHLEYPGYALGTPAELESLQGEVEALGRTALTFAVDVRDVAGVHDAVSSTVEQFGRIDILVNNAGIAAYASVDEMSDLEWNGMLDINLKGAFNLTREVVPVMRQHGGGVIINNTSALAYHGGDRLSHYVAAKHGLLGLTRAWAVELAPDGIRVMSIHSVGMIMPGFPEHRRTADPAALVRYLVSETAGAVTGEDYPMDTGLSHFP